MKTISLIIGLLLLSQTTEAIPRRQYDFRATYSILVYHSDLITSCQFVLSGRFTPGTITSVALTEMQPYGYYWRIEATVTHRIFARNREAAFDFIEEQMFQFYSTPYLFTYELLEADFIN